MSISINLQQEEIRNIISSISLPYYEIASPEKMEALSKKLVDAQQNPLASSFMKKEKDPKKVQNTLKKTHSYSRLLEKKILPSLNEELLQTKSSQTLPISNNPSNTPSISVEDKDKRGRKRKLSTSKRSEDDEEDLELLYEEAKHLPTFTAEENAYCKKVLRLLMNHEYGWPFNQPVDPKALNIPDYFDVIKHPMDFSTIMAKLQRNQYANMSEFVKDIELVFGNAKSYNAPGNDVHIMANTLSTYFYTQFHPKKKKIN